MKYYHGKKVSLNCFNNKLSIYEKVMINESDKIDDFLPPMSVGKAFVNDISLYFSNKDFQSVPVLIGSGFFAKVYLMYNSSVKTYMAFKVPKATESINKFFKEIKLLKELKNRSILKFYGTCLYNGVFGYLTEYLDSGNLASLIEEKGHELDWPTRVHIGEDISNGLVYLHDQFIVHRDLSAENILLHSCQCETTSEPVIHFRAVIADFGLFLNMKDVRADRMSTVGNPFYTAPENLKNESPYDYSSDVFSFGILLCELITGLKNDPNQIPRTNSYGLDYKKLPIKRDCPKWIQGLACDCCMVHVSYRPTMRRAYQTISENKIYIGLWHNNAKIHNRNDFYQNRKTSLSVSKRHDFSNASFNATNQFLQNNLMHNDNLITPYRKMYRHNSVDSFLDPGLINFAKAYKDPGYVDKPLTKSMKSLDPRLSKLPRCVSETGFNCSTHAMAPVLPISHAHLVIGNSVNTKYSSQCPSLRLLPIP